MAKASEAKLQVVGKDVIEMAQKRIRKLIGNNELQLPDNYSVDNAVMSWWLLLQTTTDKSNKPVLQVCTPASVMNATMDMVVQGLNPGKKQCYPIAYGTTLACQRSYFGDEAILRRIYGADTEVLAQVVWEGDKVAIAVELGRSMVIDHITSLDNLSSDVAKLRAVYAIAHFKGEDPRPSACEIMTMDQVRASWKNSKTYKEKGDCPHNQYPDEFAKRTVIRRLCKRLINAADDHYLREAVARQDMLVAEAEVGALAEDAALEAEVLDIASEPMEAEAGLAAVDHDNEWLVERERYKNGGGPTDGGGGEEAEGDGDEVPESAPATTPGNATAADGPSSPAARFMDLMEHYKLDSRPARRVLAEMVGVPDARHLCTEHFEQALGDPKAFAELVRHGAAKPAAKPAAKSMAEAAAKPEPKPESKGHEDLF